MGIEKKEYYICKCDFCGDVLQNDSGGTLCLETKKSANEHVALVWTKKNGKLACECCYFKTYER